MDGLSWKPLLKWDDLGVPGYHYFWKHPYTPYIVGIYWVYSLHISFRGQNSKKSPTGPNG